MGRNRTGPPCSVGHPTTHAPSRRHADRPRARRLAGPTAGSVTDDDDRRQRAKQYWPIRRPSNDSNNNNNNNTNVSVYDAVIMVEPLRQFSWFIWWTHNQRQAAVDCQIKPSHLAADATSTIAIYCYYLAGKQRLVLPSCRGCKAECIKHVWRPGSAWVHWWGSLLHSLQVLSRFMEGEEGKGKGNEGEYFHCCWRIDVPAYFLPA